MFKLDIKPILFWSAMFFNFGYGLQADTESLPLLRDVNLSNENLAQLAGGAMMGLAGSAVKGSTGAADLPTTDFSDKEASDFSGSSFISREELNKISAFRKQFQNIKFSTEQMLLILAPVALTLGLGGWLGYNYSDRELPEFKKFSTWYPKNNFTDKNFKDTAHGDAIVDNTWWTRVTKGYLWTGVADAAVQKFGYPLILAIAIASILSLISKTDGPNGIKLERQEKFIIFLAIYAISYFITKDNTKVASDPTKPVIDSTVQKDSDKPSKTFQFCIGYPIILSIGVIWFVSNLISKHNLKRAIYKHLDNYDPNEEKLGNAYVEQQIMIEQGAEISEDDRVTVKNNKMITPKKLHKFFDHLYFEYKKRGDSCLDKSVIEVLASQAKDLGIRIE